MPNRFDKDRLEVLGDAIVDVENDMEGVKETMAKLATIEGVRNTQDQLRKYTDDGDKGVAQAARETIEAELDRFEEIILVKAKKIADQTIDERLEERDKAYEIRKAEELQKRREGLAKYNLTINEYGQEVPLVPWLQFYAQRYWRSAAVLVIFIFIFMPDWRIAAFNWARSQMIG